MSDVTTTANIPTNNERTDEFRVRARASGRTVYVRSVADARALATGQDADQPAQTDQQSERSTQNFLLTPRMVEYLLDLWRVNKVPHTKRVVPTTREEWDETLASLRSTDAWKKAMAERPASPNQVRRLVRLGVDEEKAKAMNSAEASDVIQRADQAARQAATTDSETTEAS